MDCQCSGTRPSNWRRRSVRTSNCSSRVRIITPRRRVARSPFNTRGYDGGTDRPPVPVPSDAALVPSVADALLTHRCAELVEHVRRRERELVAGHDLPGLSVAVAVDARSPGPEGFGWADAESRSSFTPRMRFRLGALSEPWTAVAGARLRDEGRLDLDAPGDCGHRGAVIGHAFRGYAWTHRCTPARPAKPT